MSAFVIIQTDRASPHGTAEMFPAVVVVATELVTVDGEIYVFTVTVVVKTEVITASTAGNIFPSGIIKNIDIPRRYVTSDANVFSLCVIIDIGRLLSRN